MHLSSFGTLLLATGTFVSAATTSKSPTSTSSGILAVESPKWLPDFPTPNGVNSGYPTGPLNITDTLSHTPLDLSKYPEPWGKPDTNHPEVKAVIDALDWNKVPKAPTRKAGSNGDLVMTGYDETNDPYCWWSDTNCVNPKVDYLPPDISYCPRAGDWGLNYDDGPYNPIGDKEADKWAEPELYNFLAKNGNQKATLFYIGSNVATFPEAAKRALNDGHVLCVHTWSHRQMTSLSNAELVAEFYWTLRAIKEATGVTSRCWRPPYGDTDDRVRAIAWQMGMQTILWDQDTNDWDMPGEGGGKLAPSKVDGYFQGWIDTRKKGTDKHGHIVLEHELNNATVKMTEKWLPKLQENFNVVTIQQCMNVTHPYWEQNWVYNVENSNNTATVVSSSAISSATSLAASLTTPSAVPVVSAEASSSSVASADSSTTVNAGAAAANSGSSRVSASVSLFLGMAVAALYTA